MRKLALIAMITLSATAATAQWGSHFSGSGFSPSFGHSRNSHGSPHSLYDPLGIFSDPFLSGALPGQPSPFDMQPPTSGAAMPSTFAPPAQPLLIELQGNSYVRISGPEGIASETLRPDQMRHNEFPPRPDLARPNSGPNLGKMNARRRATASATMTRVSANPALASLAPVTLIFRDGHRDQVSDYAIADGILYAHADYYTDGSWSKQITLASLDLNETIKQNQSQPAPFRLPTAQNEVITRP
jgi:hypothetical protein